ncbi:MAG TPA: TOBE domain-containing protein, partial [Streptosporangiales bacterium]
WVARMLGMNAYEGVVADDPPDLVRFDGGGGVVTADAPAAGTRVLATIGPEAVALYRSRPDGSPRNTWPGAVGEVSALGGRVRVQVRGDPDIVAEVTPPAAATLGLAPGTEIWVSVKATEIRLTPL